MGNGIAVAGNMTVDQLKKIDIYPEQSKLTTIREISCSLGGAVCNCLIDLAKIDSNIPLKAISIIGNDDMGDYILNTVGQYKNIDLSRVIREGRSSFTDVMADETNKTRTFFFFRGSSSKFSDKYIDLDNIDADILHIGYILLLDGMDAKDEKYGTVMAKVLCKAKERGIKTSIDVVSEESNRYSKLVPPSLKYTDYCILNEIEAGKTVGISLRSNNGKLIAENIKEVLRKIRDMGVSRWIIIHAPESSFGLDENNNYYTVPSLKLPKDFIKGTVGAGDAFVSGVLYSAYKGYTMEKAMEIGAAAAAWSLSEADSVSGMKPFKDVIELYERMPKQTEIFI